MSNKLNLEAMRQEIDTEYAPVSVELKDGYEVQLRSLLRVEEANREQAVKLVEGLGNLSEAEAQGNLTIEEVHNITHIATALFELVAQTPEAGRALSAAIGHDLPLLLQVFQAWLKGTQAGEA